MLTMSVAEYLEDPVLASNGEPVFFKRETLEDETERCPEIYQITCSQPAFQWIGKGVVSQHGYGEQFLMEYALDDFNELLELYNSQD